MKSVLVENGEVGLENYPWFSFQASWTFLINQYWLWTSIITVYNHTNMCFGPEHPQNESMFLQNGDLFDRKWWGWSRNSSTIPLLGFVNLDNKLILNLNWYSISLQPYTHVFCAIIATKLVHFPPKWGLTVKILKMKFPKALQKMVRLDWKIDHDSHPRLHEPS